VLLLDEPTNHLDLDAIAWLEELLLGFRGAVVVITHDRAFLDRVATRIVELDRGACCVSGQLRAVPGEGRAADAGSHHPGAPTSCWRRRKRGFARAWRRAAPARRAHQPAAGLRRARHGASSSDACGWTWTRGWPATRARWWPSWSTCTWPSAPRPSPATSAPPCCGDKVGLIGPNGAGKTTLLKLILGELEPARACGAAPTCRWPTSTRCAALDPEATLADFISPGSEWIEIGARRQHVKSYLGDFLFSPARAASPVKSLSGGEGRLLLARLFARPANVLVLDEPTNDLDIDTLELLEQLLQDYEGTVFLVSHDRAFRQRGDQHPGLGRPGPVARVRGGVQDWLAQSARWQAMREAPAARPMRTKNARAGTGSARTATKRS
jgi:ATP-binding cassette subfamily F protein uup